MQVTYQSTRAPRSVYRGTRLAQKLKRVLSRFSSSVSNVTITLSGNGRISGHKPESTCQLQVELEGGGKVLVTGKGRRLRQAIRHSFQRARHIVAVEIRKRRQRIRQKIRYQEPVEA